MPTLLIVGTDTGVGKTALTLGLVSYWQQYRKPTVGLMKLLACGVEDIETYQRLLTLNQTTALCPLVFEAPLAPPLAAAQAGTVVDLGRVWQGYQQLSQEREQVFLEGVGGLGCPLTADYTVGDLARDWRVPVVLVAPVRLGVVAQLVVNSHYARALGLSVAGIVLNQTQPVSAAMAADWAPVGLIENLCRLPVLGCLPYLVDWTAVSLAQAVAGLDLEYLPGF
ncbi:dethiobiotin synthase [Candidatus Cyanaurora vandensis]|uniref:dethiobiotin synthase n=1 Tax=Candidatus Cyanaurora vandensis TaxID=2714958 RepID=UPI00257BE7DA|nr:dethiobiotin synthase [Candidatus Cyanaurora vandensis]